MTKAFLEKLRDMKVFLFGMAWFGKNSAYFKKVLGAVKENLDASVQVIGNFMLQGKMSISVLERYEKMLSSAADPARIQTKIDNFIMLLCTLIKQILIHLNYVLITT